MLSAGLSLTYQRVCKLDFSLTALIWPDLPLIKEQDFQLVYLKLLPFASWVVTGMAANYIQCEPWVVGCHQRCPSSVLVDAEADA